MTRSRARRSGLAIPCAGPARAAGVGAEPAGGFGLVAPDRQQAPVKTGAVPRYTRPVTRTYVAVVVVEVVVLAALWLLSRHFAA